MKKKREFIDYMYWYVNIDEGAFGALSITYNRFAYESYMKNLPTAW